MIFLVSDEFSGWTLRKWARYHVCELSYPTLSKLARTKKIKINQKSTNLSTLLNANDEIFINDSAISNQPHIQTKQFNNTAIKKFIIFENDDFCVIDKPHGMIAQGSNDSIACLTNGYIVQRLDKTTSGVMLIAKTKAMADNFSQQLRNHQIRKSYIAICSVANTNNQINKSGTFDSEIEGKDAITNYTVLKKDNKKLLVQFSPETGRKHQIRIHAAEHGIPILGDMTYGNHPASRIYLHSYSLSFDYQNNAQNFISQHNFNI